jgi:hypothetical protein
VERLAAAFPPLPDPRCRARGVRLTARASALFGFGPQIVDPGATDFIRNVTADHRYSSSSQHALRRCEVLSWVAREYENG